MKISKPLGKCFVALALLGAVAGLPAQTMNAPEMAPSRSTATGLLGNNYAGVGYGLIDFDGQDIDASALHLDLNQNIGRNFDAFASYEYDRSEKFDDGRITQHIGTLGLRAYSEYMDRFKPYVEAGVGWIWFRAPYGLRENSILWQAGAGVEVNVGHGWTVTPFVRYVDLHDFDDSGIWNYGVRGSYWVNERVGFQLSVTRDDDKNMEYGVGVNFRM